MSASVLTRREGALWVVGFLIVALAIAATHFTSQDPDSGLYAALAARLSLEPMSRWIAPEWWGLWTRTGASGLYHDHPIGGFILPALLARLGVPGPQAAYIVGVGAGLASLLLIGGQVRRIASREEARAAIVLLQIMPVAFIFRVRANQEYAVLTCVLLTLFGLDRARRHLDGVVLTVLSLIAAFLIKGAFVLFSLIAAAVWIVVNPTRAEGSALRAVGAVILGVGVLVATAIGYDLWYLHVTGQRFWALYWQDQMSPVTIATPLDHAGTFASHVAFYIVRLLWHPAPWSLTLLACLWQGRRTVRALAGRDPLARGLAFALGFAVLTVLALSLSSRVAERYVFSATYALGAAGVVSAWRTFPAVRRGFAWLDAAVPALPATTWTILVLLRLAVGPWLPRILWRP